MRAQLAETIDRLSVLEVRERRERALEGRPSVERCPQCGSDQYVSGEVRSAGIRFLKQDAGWLDRNFGTSTSMPARRCDDCGCTILFSESE